MTTTDFGATRATVTGLRARVVSVPRQATFALFPKRHFGAHAASREMSVVDR